MLCSWAGAALCHDPLRTGTTSPTTAEGWAHSIHSRWTAIHRPGWRTAQLYHGQRGKHAHGVGTYEGEKTKHGDSSCDLGTAGACRGTVRLYPHRQHDRGCTQGEPQVGGAVVW